MLPSSSSIATTIKEMRYLEARRFYWIKEESSWLLKTSSLIRILMKTIKIFFWRETTTFANSYSTKVLSISSWKIRFSPKTWMTYSESLWRGFKQPIFNRNTNFNLMNLILEFKIKTSNYHLQLSFFIWYLKILKRRSLNLTNLKTGQDGLS